MNTPTTMNEWLEYAVHRRSIDLLREALRCGANPLGGGTGFGSYLHTAANLRFEAGVEALLEAGYPVNATECACQLVNANGDTKDHDTKRTALHTVAGWGNATMVRTLLKYGARIDAPDAEGDTPLHVAAWKNNANTVRALCAAGANINARTDYDETPLHTAARRLAPNAVRALIEAGSDVNAPGKCGTPLFLTVLCGNDTRYESDYRDHGGLRADVRILRALLDSGAEPTRAVLAEAVSCNHTLAMRALVRAGADPTTVTPGRFVEPETRQALKELIGKHHRRVLRDAQDADGAPVAMRSRSRL
ncbi:ankyrin repeat domain-containing protein [Burkholderia multivorans]|nr:ankyrin repeat domain-containing protein [Burkholderia multivorans]